MTRLHAADTLLDLAQDDGPVGGWARDRLALWYPEHALEAPVVSRFAGLLGSEGITHAVQNGTPVTRAMALMHAGILGALNPEDAFLTASLTAATELGHPPTTLLAANALAWLGALPVSALGAVVKSGTDRALIAATVLLAQPTPEVARSVVAELDDDSVPRLLMRLGAPELLVGSDVPDVDRFDKLLTAGARAGGWSDQPGLREALTSKVRGSARSRARKVAMHLLEGIPGALPQALFALYSASRADALGRLAPVWTGWAFGQQVCSASALERVTEHHAWTVPTTLAGARATASDSVDPAHSAGSWTLAATSGTQPDAAQDALFTSQGLRHREALRLLWAPVAANAPSRVVAALHEERDLLVAFQGAGYCGTEAVVQALLDLDVAPAGPAAAVYALALLNSGDRAVLPRLRPLMGHLPRTAHHLAQALFPDL